MGKEPGLGRSNALANSWDSGIEALGPPAIPHPPYDAPLRSSYDGLARLSGKKLRVMVLSHKLFLLVRHIADKGLQIASLDFVVAPAHPKE